MANRCQRRMSAMFVRFFQIERGWMLLFVLNVRQAISLID